MLLLRSEGDMLKTTEHGIEADETYPRVANTIEDMENKELQRQLGGLNPERERIVAVFRRGSLILGDKDNGEGDVDPNKPRYRQGKYFGCIPELNGRVGKKHTQFRLRVWAAIEYVSCRFGLLFRH
jgi:hypothetical protein